MYGFLLLQDHAVLKLRIAASLLLPTVGEPCEPTGKHPEELASLAIRCYIRCYKMLESPCFYQFFELHRVALTPMEPVDHRCRDQGCAAPSDAGPRLQSFHEGLGEVLRLSGTWGHLAGQGLIMG